MLQQILTNLMEHLSPAVLWILLIGSIAATGLWRVYSAQPNWSSTRYKIATEKFDRLCSAYEQYQPPGEEAGDESKAGVLRFEGGLRDYCKAPVHHRVGDMALRAESPIQALEDIRKLPRVILYKDGVYQQRWKPYSFPTEDSYNKWQKRALILYVISAIVVGGSAMAFFTRVISFPEALLIAVSLGYFPVMFFIECLRARNRDGRLYRMSVLIKKNGGRLYEKAEAHLIPDDVVGMATKEGLTMAAAWRRYLELTQAEVAERIGISHLDYARLEASRKLRKAKRKKVAQALGISPEQLEEK